MQRYPGDLTGFVNAKFIFVLIQVYFCYLAIASEIIIL